MPWQCASPAIGGKRAALEPPPTCYADRRPMHGHHTTPHLFVPRGITVRQQPQRWATCCVGLCPGGRHRQLQVCGHDGQLNNIPKRVLQPFTERAGRSHRMRLRVGYAPGAVGAEEVAGRRANSNVQSLPLSGLWHNPPPLCTYKQRFAV